VSGVPEAGTNCTCHIGKGVFRFPKHPPKRLRFDNDGEYFGDLRIAKHSNLQLSLPPSRLRNENKPPMGTIMRRVEKSREVAMPHRIGRPPVQGLGEFNSYLDETGSHVVSQIRSADNGGIVLATLHENHEMTSEMITRLPESIANDFHASLLDSSDHTRRIFLSQDNRSFRRHNIRLREEGETSTVQLPIVLQRQRDTIPTVKIPAVYCLEDARATPRKRLGQFAERERKRRET
jgi:hypothetical protein